MTIASQPALRETVLPTLSVTVSRLIALYSDTNYSVDTVIRTLETDPAVSARVLRLANSAYYGFGSRVDTIQRAVVLLGGITVQAVALAASILTTWGNVGPPEQVEAIWINSYLCGKASRYLGMRLPRDPHRSIPDVLFIHGLLRHIGKLFFLSQAAQEYAAMLSDQPSREQLCRREAEHFGWDHAQAGATLLETWQLPERLAAITRYQYFGRLRAELRSDWEILSAAAAACDGERTFTTTLPEELLSDLQKMVAASRSEARAFYTAIS